MDKEGWLSGWRNTFLGDSGETRGKVHEWAQEAELKHHMTEKCNFLCLSHQVNCTICNHGGILVIADSLSLLWMQRLSTSGLPELLSPLASLMETRNKERSENWAFQWRWMMSVLQVNFLLVFGIFKNYNWRANSLSSCPQRKPAILYTQV